MQNSVSLTKFLEQKTLYYDKIEYNTIKQSWDVLSKYVKLPYVIHIVGTNGKGTTGRFMASFLYQLNKTVLHYTSPHIVKFNERIWLNGQSISDQLLENVHIKLQTILPTKLLNRLTYFEYTTLLALLLSDNLDYIVLEAGLGGEFDATNVVINDISIIPTIGLDHTEFLGDTIEKIATTKLRSCDNRYIFGLDIDPLVENVAHTILSDKYQIQYNDKLYVNHNLDLPQYLQNNLQLALNVINYLQYPIEHLKVTPLKGRMEKIYDNIIVDVGHNPLAANAIVKYFKNKQIVLIYNSYKDKDYKTILTIFKPIIKHIELIECDDDRMININVLSNVANQLNIKNVLFNILNLKQDEQYLVFGSFKVVQTFLEKYEK